MAIKTGEPQLQRVTTAAVLDSAEHSFSQVATAAPDHCPQQFLVLRAGCDSESAKRDCGLPTCKNPQIFEKFVSSGDY
jgi:hypothetical protein